MKSLTIANAISGFIIGDSVAGAFVGSMISGVFLLGGIALQGKMAREHRKTEKLVRTIVEKHDEDKQQILSNANRITILEGEEEE